MNNFFAPNMVLIEMLFVTGISLIYTEYNLSWIYTTSYCFMVIIITPVLQIETIILTPRRNKIKK